MDNRHWPDHPDPPPAAAARRIEAGNQPVGWAFQATNRHPPPDPPPPPPAAGWQPSEQQLWQAEGWQPATYHQPAWYDQAPERYQPPAQPYTSGGQGGYGSPAAHYQAEYPAYPPEHEAYPAQYPAYPPKHEAYPPQYPAYPPKHEAYPAQPTRPVNTEPRLDVEEPVDEEAPPAWSWVLAWTAAAFMLPVLAYLGWTWTLPTEAVPGCVDGSGAGCRSPRTEALVNLRSVLPGLTVATTLAMLTAAGLRRISHWRAPTIAFSAAVIGAGMTTLVASAIG